MSFVWPFLRTYKVAKGPSALPGLGYSRRLMPRSPSLALLLVLLFGACGGTSRGPQSRDGRYPLHGTVTASDPDRQRLTVDHSAIPGVMEAMTMEYPVKGGHPLPKLVAGDKVKATLVVQNNTYWLEDVVPDANKP